MRYSRPNPPPSLRDSWPVVAALAILCVFALGQVKAPVEGEESGGEPSAIPLEIEPLKLQEDPGPDTIYGATRQQPEGQSFVWMDALVEGGAGSFRLYFDRQDHRHFHFLDREGTRLSLGLCEGGAEQVFASAHLAAEELSGPQRLRLARHGPQIGVFQGHHLLLSAFDDRRQGGVVGLRGPGGLQLRVEPREEIHFADDFMREENDSFEWRKITSTDQSGYFQIKSLRSPLLSANAFCYMGKGAPVLSVAGQPWWDNYQFEVALRGPKEGQIGLVFAFQDDRNYGLFRWRAAGGRSGEAGHAATEAEAGEAELVKVVAGQEVVLARSPLGYRPDQWYQARIQVAYSGVEVQIDGHCVFERSAPELTAGCVGVWCNISRRLRRAEDPRTQDSSQNSLFSLMTQHAVFDDVRVKSHARISEDFGTPGPLAGGWRVGTGSWVVAPSVALNVRPGTGELLVHPQGLASKSLIGSSEWSQYELSCQLERGPGAAGLVFLYQDESNHYRATVERNELCLVRVSEGQLSVVDRAQLPAPAPTGGAALEELRAWIKHGHVRVAHPSGAVVEHFESRGGLRGRAGLWAGSTEREPLRFRRFRLEFLSDPEPLVSANAVFEHETQYMGDWTDPRSEWGPLEGGPSAEPDACVPQWHCCQFPGDGEFSVEPRRVLEPRHELLLVLAREAGQLQSGYTLRYRKEGTLPVLSLLREGRVVQEREGTLLRAQGLTSLGLRRSGRYLVGKLNGSALLVFRDELPLDAARVAYCARGLEVKAETARIVSAHFQNDLFAGAPVNWRTNGEAIFEISNRWQCDSRWTFACLENDREKGKAAVLWNKRLYPGDVTVQFFVGIRMDHARGYSYNYARDINLTICSNGQDLTKGYTCMFGGNGNSGTMLYRDGVQVAGAPELTIPMDKNFLHRHWFSILVEKRGKRITYRIDRANNGGKAHELTFEDPQPLKGDRIAIWTYDHAIVLSRVLISGEGGVRCEDPATPSETVKTLYDLPGFPANRETN